MFNIEILFFYLPIYTMGNEWIEFVRQFAKENKVSYTQALKKAGPVYRKMKNSLVGRGLEDLPEAMQKEVGTHLTDQELGRLNTTSRGMDRANASTLEDRRLQLEARELDQIVNTYGVTMVDIHRNPQAALDKMNRYYRTFSDVLETNPFLREEQRQRLEYELNLLEKQYTDVERNFM